MPIIYFFYISGYYDKEKEKLANMMAFGEDIVPQKHQVYRPAPRKREEVTVDRFDECNYFCSDLYDYEIFFLILYVVAFG